ncbi:Phosphoglucosamine mutase, partial [Actinidia chinensis var. chinensis]
MPRKISPIFRKVSNLFQVSIFMAKMKKIPIIKKTMFLKKSSRLKKFKPLHHYNYGYIKEYKFSPSSTHLIHHHKTPF